MFEFEAVHLFNFDLEGCFNSMGLNIFKKFFLGHLFSVGFSCSFLMVVSLLYRDSSDGVIFRCFTNQWLLDLGIYYFLMWSLLYYIAHLAVVLPKAEGHGFFVVFFLDCISGDFHELYRLYGGSLRTRFIITVRGKLGMPCQALCGLRQSLYFFFLA